MHVAVVHELFLDAQGDQAQFGMVLVLVLAVAEDGQAEALHGSVISQVIQMLLRVLQRRVNAFEKCLREYLRLDVHRFFRVQRRWLLAIRQILHWVYQYVESVQHFTEEICCLLGQRMDLEGVHHGKEGAGLQVLTILIISTDPDHLFEYLQHVLSGLYLLGIRCCFLVTKLALGEYEEEPRHALESLLLLVLLDVVVNIVKVVYFNQFLRHVQAILDEMAQSHVGSLPHLLELTFQAVVQIVQYLIVHQEIGESVANQSILLFLLLALVGRILLLALVADVHGVVQVRRKHLVLVIVFVVEQREAVGHQAQAFEGIDLAVHHQVLVLSVDQQRIHNQLAHLVIEKLYEHGSEEGPVLVQLVF